MSIDGWNTVLVLGGIRSGKSEFAESLIADAASVRYIATAVGGQDDPEWLARIDSHQQRRPQAWSTEEAGADPGRLATLIAEAKPDETLLVDDLGGWVTVLLDPAQQPSDDPARVADLAAAVRGCAARLVLVSPEVGLSLVPLTPVGRAFADALGSTNQALADACDHVVLVVAGQPFRLKPATGPGERTPATGRSAAAPNAPVTAAPHAPVTAAPVGPAPAAAGTAAGDGAALPDVLPQLPVAPPAAEHRTAAPPEALTGPTMSLPTLAAMPVFEPGLDLPIPDDDAGRAARDRLTGFDVAGAGLGVLERAVEFAAATQGTPVPRAWHQVRVLLLHGDHAGGAAAGDDPAAAARRAEQARRGEGALGRLTAAAAASLQVVEAPPAAAMEDGPALTREQVDAALQLGWRLAQQAADDGVAALVLAACGAGTDAAAAAVLAATAGAEPAAVLARVVAPGGDYDDPAWMSRCAAVRDAVHRSRDSSRDAHETLGELAGGDIAVATGVLLGAAARRLPVLIDGPVGAAAVLVTRELAGQARLWCLLPDHGRHPGVRLAGEVLNLDTLFDLRLDLGEGSAALAALPLLRTAVGLAGTLPAHPALLPETAPDDAAPDDADPAAAGPPDPTGFPPPAPPAQPTLDPHPAAEQQPTPDPQPAPGIIVAADSLAGQASGADDAPPAGTPGAVPTVQQAAGFPGRGPGAPAPDAGPVDPGSPRGA